MGEQIQSFRDLVAWRKGVEFARACYRVSRLFPPEERFAMSIQLRRAAVSVTSNIAEGHARQGNEFPHFLSISRGSLAESESLAEVAVQLGFVEAHETHALFDQAEELRRILSSLEAKVRLSHQRPQ